jgi:hypothetical protein
MKIRQRASCGYDMGDIQMIVDERFRILGTDYRVRIDDRALGAKVRDLFDSFERTAKAARATNTIQLAAFPDGTQRLLRDCYRVTVQGPATQLLPALVSTINRSAVEESEELAIHAGVVVIGNSTIAFPSISGNGKTTLTAACLLSGFSYISDEALVLDAGGAVIPYPKPLALSEWSCETLGIAVEGEETLVTAADLGAAVAQGGTQVTDIVVGEFGHTAEELVPLPKSAAVPVLLGLAFNHFKDPDRAFRIATDIAAKTRVWKLDYGDPRRAALMLRDHLGPDAANSLAV